MTGDKRAALAFIALAAAPTPHRIQFDGTSIDLSMNLYSIADLRAWLAVFGVPDAQVNTQTIKQDDRAATLATAIADWSGFHCYLSAVDVQPTDQEGGTTHA